MWFSRLITTCLVVGVITTHCEHLHSQLNDFCTFRVQGEVFCDDYSDMNPLDDDPVTWSPIGGSTLDASSGDLVVNGRVQIENAPDPNWRFSGASVMSTFSDMSLRTQARLAQDRSWVAITVRENNAPISNGYGFSINAVW